MEFRSSGDLEVDLYGSPCIDTNANPTMQSEHSCSADKSNNYLWDNQTMKPLYYVLQHPSYYNPKLGNSDQIYLDEHIVTLASIQL